MHSRQNLSPLKSGFTAFKDAVPEEIINELRFRKAYPHLTKCKDPVMSIRCQALGSSSPATIITSLFITEQGEMVTEYLSEVQLQNFAWARRISDMKAPSIKEYLVEGDYE